MKKADGTCRPAELVIIATPWRRVYNSCFDFIFIYWHSRSELLYRVRAVHRLNLPLSMRTQPPLTWYTSLTTLTQA